MTGEETPRERHKQTIIIRAVIIEFNMLDDLTKMITNMLKPGGGGG